MTPPVLASYAITGTREIWPLLVVAGLLVLLVTGLLVAQLTDPDRTRRADTPEEAPDEPPDVDLPQQDRRSE